MQSNTALEVHSPRPYKHLNHIYTDFLNDVKKDERPLKKGERGYCLRSLFLPEGCMKASKVKPRKVPVGGFLAPR
ncbi:MAG: hypothetical protein A2170_01190 [Deltaproteobacteria bacterium RBG_13_53_10]|nr:MAG: hypothetical protein A2170_01190 [Deltaproteobacteria bacterium RBG_13_53_10]